MLFTKKNTCKLALLIVSMLLAGVQLYAQACIDSVQINGVYDNANTYFYNNTKSIQLKDGNLLHVAIGNRFYIQARSALISKTSINGNLQLSKRINFLPGEVLLIEEIKETNVDNIYLAGYVVSTPSYGVEHRQKIVIIKLNSNLEIIWKKFYWPKQVTNGYYDFQKLRIVVDKDENLFFTKNISHQPESLGINVITTSINKMGEIQWSRAESSGVANYLGTVVHDGKMAIQGDDIYISGVGFYIAKANDTKPAQYVLHLKRYSKINGDLKLYKTQNIEVDYDANEGLNYNFNDFDMIIKTDEINLALAYTSQKIRKSFVANIVLDTNFNVIKKNLLGMIFCLLFQ